MKATLCFVAAGIVASIFATILAVVAWFANEWILSTLVTVTLLAWLVGWLVIAYGRGRMRAAAIGAVVAGAAYWLLALGPRFHVNIGSTLLTSRLLNWIEANYRQPAQPPAANPMYTSLDIGGYITTNAIVTGNSLPTPSSYIVTTAAPPPAPSPALSNFQSAGHWSFAWLFAAAGGGLAAWLQQRKTVTADSEAAP